MASERSGMIADDENGRMKRTAFVELADPRVLETRLASQADEDFPESMSADDQFTEYGERRQ
jgi:hypothetical protein